MRGNRARLGFWRARPYEEPTVSSEPERRRAAACLRESQVARQRATDRVSRSRGEVPLAFELNGSSRSTQAACGRGHREREVKATVERVDRAANRARHGAAGGRGKRVRPGVRKLVRLPEVDTALGVERPSP